MKYHSILAAMLMASLLTGCSEDEPAYREYRKEDGTVVREYLPQASQNNGSGGSFAETMAGAAVGSMIGNTVSNALSDRDRDRQAAGGGYYPPAKSGYAGSAAVTSSGASAVTKSSPSVAAPKAPAPAPVKASITARGSSFGGLGMGG